MKGDAHKLHEFVEGQKIRFIIPVYQRNYDWLIENCDQLFNDLVKLSQTDNVAHFFGSVVTSPAGSGFDRLVIDGQQRLTTISLLLLAGIKATQDNALEVKDKSKIDEAKEVFLMAKFCKPDIIKLIPIEGDRIAYDHIFYTVLPSTAHGTNESNRMAYDHINNGDNTYDEGSKVMRNFRHFYDRLTKEKRFQNFDQLFDAIARLQIISIELGPDDDAQLIFESLNSTGLALTEADKVRNFLLMGLKQEDQKDCYEKYWREIENSTDKEPTMFLRDYLTIKEQLPRHVRQPDMYREWKKYMEGHDRKEELAEMLKYAQCYRQITKAEFADPILSEKIRHICNIETDLANVFFIQFFLYATEQKMAKEEMLKVIDLVENYLARRIVCNRPTNALTQVFCALHKDVLKSIEEYRAAHMELKSSYSDILAYHILRRNGTYEMPKDADFENAISTRDAYHMPKPYQIFLFERLENDLPGEYNDVAKEMKDGVATLEHIMPRTLNNDWKEMLGDNFEEIHETYLHTFANLTLTGINSTLSNNSFAVKRNGKTSSKGETVPGYKNSKYRLTKGVSERERWTEAELKERRDEIEHKFLSLYPMPKTTFAPLPKPVDEVTLEDDTFTPTFRSLKSFRLFGEEHATTSWKDMLVSVVQIVTARHPDTVDSLYGSKGPYFFTSDKRLKYCTPIAQHRFLTTAIDNKTKISCIRLLFEKCDIAESELVFILEPRGKCDITEPGAAFAQDYSDE